VVVVALQSCDKTVQSSDRADNGPLERRVAIFGRRGAQAVRGAYMTAISHPPSGGAESFTTPRSSFTLSSPCNVIPRPIVVPLRGYRPCFYIIPSTSCNSSSLSSHVSSRRSQLQLEQAVRSQPRLIRVPLRKWHIPEPDRLSD
jgi:hypothetical protein